MKSLRQILQMCGEDNIPITFDDILINDIFLDSRECRPGSLFCAVKGTALDGQDFIENAIEKGVVAVFTAEKTKQYEVPVITLPNLKDKLGKIASYFYNSPSAQLTVVGVTGTNGKTSVSHFMAQCLNQLGKPCGGADCSCWI